MSDDRSRRARELFDRVVDLPPGERDAFLAEACAGDRELEDEVRSLVEAAEQSDGFLDSGQVGRALAGIDADPVGHDPLIGAVIGEYRVIELLARGGMGAVYLAEQENPRRKVALKLIDRGIGSPEMVRRFEFEAQVLGRLKHPGIAQIYLAGTAGAELGHRPWFAMELVDGLPLTAWADERNLGRRERLELMIRVCEGVQHAHQVGVIHRDLKPGNILVTAEGQPKILDFGIARSTDADLQVTTLARGQSSLVGTLPYMSPEQVRGNPDELDTRADVYALGVLCFELLAGRLPRDLEGKTLTEAIRTVVEEEPRTLSAAAGRRFPADLETIVAMALDGDRQRRYDSPSALAADLQRYLDGQPISARPQSALYQLRKLVARNRLPAALLALLLLFSLGAAVVMGVLGRRAARARDRASVEAETANEVSNFLESLFLEADPEQALGETLTAREILDRGAERIGSELLDQPAVRGRLLAMLGKVYESLGQRDRALHLLEEAVEIGRSLRADGADLPGDPSNQQLALTLLARLYAGSGRNQEAIALCREAAELTRAIHGEASVPYATSLNHIGYQLSLVRAYDEARDMIERGLALRERLLGPEHVDVGWSHYQLAWVEKLSGQAERACDEFGLAVAIWEKALPENHPQIATCRLDYANQLYESGRFEEALAQAEKALAVREKTLGPEHPALEKTLSDVRHLHWRLGHLPEARRYAAEAVAARKAAFGAGDIGVLTDLFALARMNGLLNDTAGEEAALREAAALAREHHDGSPDLVGALARLGLFYGFQGRPAEAGPLLREAIRLDRTPPGRREDLMPMVLEALSGVPEGATGDERGSLASRLEERARSLPGATADDVRIGKDLLRLGRCAEAESYLRALLPAVERAGGDVNRPWHVRWLLGHCCHDLGRWDEARAWYDEVLQADPRGPGPEPGWRHLRAAEDHAAHGRMDRAVSRLEAALATGLPAGVCRQAIFDNDNIGETELHLLYRVIDEAADDGFPLLDAAL